MQQDPRQAQWQQRFDAAQAEVKSAEASGDARRVRAAYERLRQVQSVRPRGDAQGQGRSGGALRSKPKNTPRQSGNPFSLISNAMRNARENNQ